jgi:multidrug efflux system outer membrane protein
MNRLPAPARALAPLAAAALLAGCASLAPPAPATVAPPATAWQAPLPAPNAAGPAADLRRWWRQFDDPLLPMLIDRAQAASPTLADASARIAQARAAAVSAGAALGPTLDGSASLQRGRSDLTTPTATVAQLGLQAGWELDLFGRNASARDAAAARLTGAQAGWHDARTAVAAETANAYLNLRACEAQLALTTSDAASRAETARLTGLAAKAGFQPPAAAALADASAAQASAQLTQQKAACTVAVKGLVALTASDEAALRAELAGAAAKLPAPAALAVAAVPGEALAQRPDVAAAERAFVAAGFDRTSAERARLPRITLSGSIAAGRVRAGGASFDGNTWSIGPLAVSLPIFDGGARRANADAAQVAADAARSRYAATLRNAVREVEEALVALQSTSAQQDDARRAAAGYEAAYRATEARQRGGLASLFELEDARRTALAAQSALLELNRQRVAAWITLYRALGGGWQAGDTIAAAPAAAPTNNTKTTP